MTCAVTGPVGARAAVIGSAGTERAQAVYPGMRLLLAVLFLLAAAPAAHAGGFATVGLSSTPSGHRLAGRDHRPAARPHAAGRRHAARRHHAGRDHADVRRASPPASRASTPPHVVFPRRRPLGVQRPRRLHRHLPHTFPAVTLPGRVASPASPAPAPAGDDGGDRPRAADPGRARAARRAGAPAPAPHPPAPSGARAVKSAAAALAVAGRRARGRGARDRGRRRADEPADAGRIQRVDAARPRAARPRGLRGAGLRLLPRLRARRTRPARWRRT